MDAYKIELEAFSGPMELLMSLIEKNKIDIHDIPIGELTAQYMDYLDKFREFNIEIASEFLVMAATLLSIKARMMLPKPPAPEKEEPDPRESLVQSLIEYKRFKEVSRTLAEIVAEQGNYFARGPTVLPVRHLPPEHIELDLLIEAFRNMLAVKEELAIPSVLVAPEEFSIKSKMAEILSLMHRAGGQLLFSEAFSYGSRPEIIATFLALLELIKLKTITVQQPRLFAEIYISLQEPA